VSYEVHNAGTLSGLEHRSGLAGVTGERLFAQDMTASRYRTHYERTMRVRWGRYIDHLRAGAPDRLIEISECLRHSAALGTLTSTLGVRSYEAHDVEARGS
jgi:hypothetical protein